MNDILVGIDFSILSPAFCILKNDKYEFFAFPRGIEKNLLQTLLDSNVNVLRIQKEILSNKADISTKERYNSIDAERMISTIVNHLSPIFTKNTVAGIEGIAFMARGNSIAQIAGYHYVLRYVLSKTIKYENIHVFSPSSVKKIAGKGNFKKVEMIEAFINSEDKILQNTLFHQTLKANPSLFQTKKGGFRKPVDDLVDSFFVLKTLLIKCDDFCKIK